MRRKDRDRAEPGAKGQAMMRMTVTGLVVGTLIGLMAQVAASQTPGTGVGPVTNLPLPRYVSLKGNEGKVRRGPGQSHRVDWVFTAAGLPLRITAEHENWRRIEDHEGAGGWVHYSLLSGRRMALVTQDMIDVLAKPDPRAMVQAKAEAGAIVRLLECGEDWCRIASDGLRGWVPKAALWGVEADETIR
jgi:SH3-like domain-containing protein